MGYGRSLQVKRHKQRSTCTEKLCCNPEHWNVGWDTPALPFVEQMHNDNEALALEEAMSGNREALRAMGFLAWHNVAKFGQWKPTVLAILKSL